MVQRGLDYAAGTVIICAIGAAMLLLAGEILSFSSPVADAAAALGAAVLINPLRRRIPGMARRRSGPRTRIASGDAPAGISAGVRHPDGRHPLGRLGYRQRGSYPGVRSHPGRIAAERTLVTGGGAARCGRRGVDQTPAWPARCQMEPADLTGYRPAASGSTSPGNRPLEGHRLQGTKALEGTKALQGTKALEENRALEANDATLCAIS
jgi:hypothetical protein